MSNGLFIQPQPTAPVRQPVHKPKGRTGAAQTSFGTVLDQQLKSTSLRFSNHAAMRMQSRGVALNTQDMGRLEDAVQKASAKGAKDSLVLLDDTALVVSVKNSTVVTVMDRENLRGNVFTNIDSAVIA